MSLTKFVNKKVLKNVIVMLKNGDHSSIEFDSNDDCETYIITNPIAFLKYISDVLLREYKEKYVIVSMTEFPQLLRVLKYLHEKVTEGKDIYQLDFTKQYNRHLQSDEVNQINLTPDIGHGDKPFSFELVVVIDPHSLTLDKTNHTTTNNNTSIILSTVDSIYIHQYSRYFTLKHGGRFVIVNDLDVLTKESAHSFIKYVHALSEAQPIFESSKKKIFNQDFIINLFIPKAWDSWNKISLISKSSVFHDNNTLLNNVEIIQQLDQSYNRFLSFDNMESNFKFEDYPLLSFKQSNTISTPPTITIQQRLSFHDLLNQALQ
ncbi:hypothetical protein DFJ63DRAFT_315320 [Scheffersomyces coipomensis]|uniref:uncharacterized protein n=1 Tax=Scheffersomyces coipomensis TaxID=1788519 RepID=UPI00315CD81F